MTLKRFLSATAVATTLLWATAAHADLYQFTISGDYSATWQLDSEALPDEVSFGERIAYIDVVGSYDGAATEYADIIFWNAQQDGGLTIQDYYGDQVLLDSVGLQIYGGSEDSPLFMTGVYSLTELEGTGQYTLTISAVPEPATYGMVLAGVGLIGAVMRRRQVR